MPFKKGVDPNRNVKGRPIGGGANKLLMDAIKKVEQEQNIDYMKESIEESRKNPQLRAAILKKIIPDLSSVQMQAEIQDSRDLKTLLSEAEEQDEPRKKTDRKPSADRK